MPKSHLRQFVSLWEKKCLWRRILCIPVPSKSVANIRLLGFFCSLGSDHWLVVESEQVDLADSRFGVRSKEDFVVALAQKSHLEGVPLHEDAIQLSSCEGSELDGISSPAHNMRGPHCSWNNPAKHSLKQVPLSTIIKERLLTNAGDRSFSPLEEGVPEELAFICDVCAFTVVAKEERRLVWLGKRHCAVGFDGVTSEAARHEDVLGAGIIHDMESVVRSVDHFQHKLATCFCFTDSHVHKQRLTFQVLVLLKRMQNRLQRYSDWNMDIGSRCEI